MFDTAFLITAFTTLFVVIDPMGSAPIVAALTHDMEAKERRAVALRACITAALILALFAACGEAVLAFVGISLAAFRVAGGALLFLTALDMLFERRTKRRENTAEADDRDDPSVFPLAMPLTAGPGAIATMILLAGQNPGVWGVLQAIGVMLVVVLLVLVMFLSAAGLAKLLGKTGLNVVTRLLGMLLAALSVQFILEGLRDFSLMS